MFMSAVVLIFLDERAHMHAGLPHVELTMHAGLPHIALAIVDLLVLVFSKDTKRRERQTFLAT